MRVPGKSRLAVARSPAFTAFTNAVVSATSFASLRTRRTAVGVDGLLRRRALLGLGRSSRSWPCRSRRARPSLRSCRPGTRSCRCRASSVMLNEPDRPGVRFSASPRTLPSSSTSISVTASASFVGDLERGRAGRNLEMRRVAAGVGERDLDGLDARRARLGRRAAAETARVRAAAAATIVVRRMSSDRQCWFGGADRDVVVHRRCRASSAWADAGAARAGRTGSRRRATR